MCHAESMTDRPLDARRVSRSADGWVECSCGSRHWGLRGAAGLLLVQGDEIVVQHRASWSHHGDTWGLPGGAVDHGESAVQGALREAHEEAGIPASIVRPRVTWVLDHGDWSYTTVVADALERVTPTVTDAESADVRWVPLDEVADRPLLPAFAAALPALTELIRRRVVLLVDAANTVGSRPDGWWRDRGGATRRLRDELAEVAEAGLPAQTLGLPGHTWFPEVTMVAEGAARGVASSGSVVVIDAPGDGDSAILRSAERLGSEPGTTVVAVTSDRELRQRLETIGVVSIGPRSLPLRR